MSVGFCAETMGGEPLGELFREEMGVRFLRGIV